MPTFPCEQEGVLELLPHRDPFVWVSRIISCTPGESIIAELDVDPNLPLFAGHFPGHPVLPGDTVTLDVIITKKSKRFCKAEVVARKGDTVCASALQSYVIAKA